MNMPKYFWISMNESWVSQISSNIIQSWISIIHLFGYSWPIFYIHNSKLLVHNWVFLISMTWIADIHIQCLIYIIQFTWYRTVQHIAMNITKRCIYGLRGLIGWFKLAIIDNTSWLVHQNHITYRWILNNDSGLDAFFTWWIVDNKPLLNNSN